jgi:hypothetical protein
MVAMVVFLFASGRAHRGLDGGRTTGDDRPRTRRAEMQWTAAGDGFFVSRCKAAGGGKKLATGVAGKRARRSRFSVRPNPFEDAVGVADREIRGTWHWRQSASPPNMKTVANLRSR